MASLGQRGGGGSSLEYPLSSVHDKENKQSKLQFNPRMSKYGQGSFRSSGINLPQAQGASDSPPKPHDGGYKSSIIPESTSPYQPTKPYNETKPLVPFRRKLSSKLNNYKDDQPGASKPSSRPGRNRVAASGLANGNGYNGPTPNDMNSGSAYIKPMNDEFFEKMISGDDSYGRSHRQAANNQSVTGPPKGNDLAYGAFASKQNL